ncbi:hypothetical protein HELRODRAFT_115877 [Helobdella robusta]|uniref:Thioredoxin domain-containing protein n=1 Tax=Helobdella robusta TaxID=6412 RepID=T1EGB4_HELRO|nr:hypothetical protein HELRODRAFT_115877 [Helobdella robusta]ESN92531.1 hypothetical protein HELRODRAFT_115877 [Helobdella robusta]
MIRLSCISLILLVLLSHISIAQKSKQNDYIQKLSDVKEFKKLIRTHTNVLAIFTQSEKDFKQQDLFRAVGEKVKGIASIILFDCSIDKKSCKKLKSFPSPVEYKHFKDGEFHKVYDRKFTVKSMVKFLRNPTSDRPWEEEASASDVRHLETKSDLNKLLSKEKKPILIMFYAPWCGFCKKLKPEFAEAASILKGEAVLAGMDVDTLDGEPIRMEFNITGFPTLIYFKNGEKVYNYGGSNDRDGVVAWMRNPVPAKVEEPEKDWSEMDNDVIHLTEDNFDDIINASSSALVMFYAPWCGHCKKMKPEYEVAATMLKNEKLDGILTAIDVTKHQKLGEKFKIKGFPTVKYFKNGEEKFDVNERTAQTIVSFMKDPKEPPAAASDKPWGELDSYVEHLNDENFKSFIKKKKHCLVIFYAPWCGHCKKSKPEFMQAAEELKDDYKISFAAVDCTSPSSSSTCQSNDVTGYPTFKYFNYGKNDQIYYGGREKKDFISFMLNPTASSSPPPKPSSDDRLWRNIAGSDVISFLDASTFASHLERFDIVVVAFFADGYLCVFVVR